MILARHARKLLTGGKLGELGRFAADLDFHRVTWLRKEAAEQVKLVIGERLLERFTATSVGRGQVGEVGERLPGAWRTGLASCTWTVETGQTLAMSQAVCLCYQSRQLMLC